MALSQEKRTLGSARKQNKFIFPLEAVFAIVFTLWVVVCIAFYSSNPSGPAAAMHDENRPPGDATAVLKPELRKQQPAVRVGQRRPEVRVTRPPAMAERRPPKAKAPDDEKFPEHYMTFSTACSESQNWQSFMFFYYAHKVQQPGHVVRIASGCTGTQKKELIKFHQSVISKLSDKFSVHFTPDFARISGDNYKYYNKPFGLQHWLTHGLKYEENRDEYEDAIIMILDPDMILLRPLTYDFDGTNVMIHQSKRGAPSTRRVMHGQPWASLYAFGTGPFRVDTKYVFANYTDSPALRLTSEEQMNNYPGGPPYMATGRDMFAIVTSWCELVPRVHDVYKHLLGEMYGWSLAAAHLGLPHTLSESFMVSAVDIGSGEGWRLIDNLGDDEICEFSTLKEKEDKLPYTMHYCQNYWLGKWFIGKYRLDSDFLKCEKPLLLEPPTGIHEKYDFYIKPGGNPYGTRESLRKQSAKREEFMICGMIKRLNDAATWIKSVTCEEGTANLKKEFIFHHSLDPNNNEGGEKKAKW